MKDKEHSAWQGLLHSLRLPEYALSQQSHLELFGKNEMVIENAKGILEYDDDYIKIVLGNYNLVVMGRNLCVDMFVEKNIILRGQIQSISFE